MKLFVCITLGTVWEGMRHDIVARFPPSYCSFVNSLALNINNINHLLPWQMRSQRYILQDHPPFKKGDSDIMTVESTGPTAGEPQLQSMRRINSTENTFRGFANASKEDQV